MGNGSGQISRRTLLVGGGALAVAAGGAAVASSHWTRIAHAVGWEKSPDAAVPRAGAPVRTFELHSAAMRGTVRVGIAAPPDARGILLCLHGRNGDYRTAFDAVHVHRFVAAASLPIAVVAMDGGADTYWHKRRSGVDPQAMLHDELLPRLDNEVGVGLPVAIMGWSMGGYGALLAAERHPNLYKVAVGSSPALFRSFADASPGAFDDAADYTANDVFGALSQLREVTVRVDCGTNDPFLPAVKAFAARLPAPNPGTFTSGFHDAPYWRSVAAAQIHTIGAALGVVA